LVIEDSQACERETRCCAVGRSTLVKPTEEIAQAQSDFRSLSVVTDIPLKYLPRAVAVLDRFGLVTIQRTPANIRIRACLPDTLKSSGKRPPRAQVEPALRRHIYEADGGRCGITGVKTPLQEAVLDHIIPFAYGGADHPANLVTARRAVNATKWDNLAIQLLWYRGAVAGNRILAGHKR
jgi:hypothetical protein